MEEQPGILDQGRLRNRPGRGRSSFCIVVVVVFLFYETNIHTEQSRILPKEYDVYI